MDHQIFTTKAEHIYTYTIITLWRLPLGLMKVESHFSGASLCSSGYESNLLTQGSWVRSLVGELTASCRAATREPTASRACAPQQEAPLHCNENLVQPKLIIINSFCKFIQGQFALLILLSPTHLVAYKVPSSFCSYSITYKIGIMPIKILNKK